MLKPWGSLKEDGSHRQGVMKLSYRKLTALWVSVLVGVIGVFSFRRGPCHSGDVACYDVNLLGWVPLYRVGISISTPNADTMTFEATAVPVPFVRRFLADWDVGIVSVTDAHTGLTRNYTENFQHSGLIQEYRRTDYYRASKTLVHVYFKDGGLLPAISATLAPGAVDPLSYFFFFGPKAESSLIQVRESLIMVTATKSADTVELTLRRNNGRVFTNLMSLAYDPKKSTQVPVRLLVAHGLISIERID